MFYFMTLYDLVTGNADDVAWSNILIMLVLVFKNTNIIKKKRQSINSWCSDTMELV